MQIGITHLCWEELLKCVSNDVTRLPHLCDFTNLLDTLIHNQQIDALVLSLICRNQQPEQPEHPNLSMSDWYQ